MNYVTLPLPIFLLVLGVVAVGAALLTATVAERLTRVRRAARRALAASDADGADDASAPFTSGAVQLLHRRAAELAARDAVHPVGRLTAGPAARPADRRRR